MALDGTTDERSGSPKERYWHPVGPMIVSANSTMVFQTQFLDRHAGWDHKSAAPPPYVNGRVHAMKMSKEMMMKFTLNDMIYTSRMRTDEERRADEDAKRIEAEFVAKFREGHGATHPTVAPFPGWFGMGSAVFHGDCAECEGPLREWSRLAVASAAHWSLSQKRPDLRWNCLADDVFFAPLDERVPAGMMLILSVSNRTNIDREFRADYDVEVVE